MHPILLTQTVQKGGCAAKIPALELRKILESVPFPKRPPALLVDGSHFDDAAIYQIDATTALVQTLDFFTPILDTPFEFGRVATANALSDVYAMGGRPITAMGILAAPLATLSAEVIGDVLRGACAVLADANTPLVGGHSIDDDTLKFGLSVTGLVHPGKIWANTGACVGDTLILTKGLGTGTLAAALKRQAIREENMREAIDSMVRLNDVASVLGEELCGAIHAATDVTGFGLSGHAYNMARASGVLLQISFADLPVLEGAQDCLKDGFLTKAHRSNREYTAKALDAATLQPLEQLVLHDPQTSGGLLLAVDSTVASHFVSRLQQRFPRTAVIGTVVATAENSPICVQVS